MIRVGIDGHMIGDYSGGNESYYRNILTCMQIPSDVKAYLFLNEGADDTPFKDRFKIVRLKSSNAFRRNFVDLPRIAKQLKLDILHTQYYIPFKTPCKVACTIHDICFEHYNNIFNKKQYYSQKLLIPYSAKHSDVIFTVSNFSKNDIVKTYHVNPKKIEVTYNAVNEKFCVLPDSAKELQNLIEKFKIPNEKYVLSVGNLQPRKNIVRLIQAFKTVEEEHPDTCLVIVGKKAWMFNDIIKEALDGTIRDKVVFTDYVSDEDLVKLYNYAICFAYPSYYEGFGIPPLEAMACGTPVVLSNVTSLPEVAGDSAVYFDPFNIDEIAKAIDKILSDTNLQESLRTRGLEQVKKYNWKSSADIIIQAYQYC